MMNKFDKFKKAVEKKNFNIGLSPVRDWISTGNSGLNNIISGDLSKGIAVGRTTAFAGLQGSGKSFLLANVIANAQKKGYFVVFVDTEYATSDGFMEKIGVDLGEDSFMAVNTAILEHVLEFSAELFKNTDPEDKILLAVDSLSNLNPERDYDKFDDAKVAYGQGLREKMLKMLVNNINSRVGGRNMGFVFTSHMYVNGSDQYGNPILKPNIGEATLYLPSSVIQLTKKELKDGKEVEGIQVACKMMKSRFTMTASKCGFNLPWNSGMDFYDGSLEILESAGVIGRNGAWYSYTNRETKETVKFQKSSYYDHVDLLMTYYSQDVDVIEKDDAGSVMEAVATEENHDLIGRGSSNDY